ncbi:hypothetical protein KUTeg_002327 [Tegillarca granosa]|uniref:C2H2-type domain-containing protein n=1 Tax=Tegillarca granosa TaxID=220873 RepID=A0ABQ9FWS9_TEGGR|nr:hypothetical protein KUTeg_002327 [Tegillarca granosa]
MKKFQKIDDNGLYKFHELQDRITPVAYESYEPDESCPQECQYNMKERHYHCIWSGCSHVVPHAGPTFGRLEHYRIHEFARTSAGKSYKSSPKLDDSNCPRRRGRPPKYPKNEIPVIPKIELSEEEIQESRKVAVNETENAKVINGFRTFAENELCPDELCIYRSKHHFHCARPRCHHATDRMDVLNLHAKDFHSFVTILDGFEFFDRNINCRRSHCHNNKANRHFHCIKPKCDYSFVRHSTMIQHDKKHKLCNSEKVQSVPLKKDFPVSLAQTFIPIVPALQTGTPSVIQAVPGTPLVKVSLPSHQIPVTPGSESSVPAVVSSSPVIQTVTNLSPADTPKSAQPGTVIVSPMCATAAAQAVSTGPVTSSSAHGSVSTSSSPAATSNCEIQTVSKLNSSNAVNTSVIMSGTNVLPKASVDSINKPIVKTAGTFYPLSGLAKADAVTLSSVGALSLPNSTLAIAVNPMQTVALSTLPLISPPCGTTVAPLASPLISTAVNQLPLTVLLQQKGNNPIPSPDWPVIRNKMHFSVDQNCGRPFCKLKKKDHFHCFECNQAFSDPARIKIHMGKHGLKFSKLETPETYQPITIAPKPIGTVVNTEYKISMSGPQATNPPTAPDGALSDVDSDDNDEKSSSLNLNPSAFSSMIAKAQKENAAKTSFNLSDDYFSKSLSDTDNDSISGKLVIADIDNNGVSNTTEDDSLDSSMFTGNIDEAGNSSVSKWSGRKRTAPKHDDFVDSNTVVVKQRKTSNTNNNSPRTAKDDSIPDGYIRYRFKEDCKYPKCAYRQGVTHFHCSRSDCGYSFSDRSRLIQHTLRHERIDSLTGGEMQQFRINQDCCRTGCEFVGKASHFHCLKCDYSCTDSSKVLTHRKHHAKMESINQQGFHKYSVSEDCGIDGCHYSTKQTHYHCLKTGCNYAVTGPAQMSSHKMKHAND